MAQQCSDQQLLETRLLDCTVTAGPGSCRYQVFFLIFLGHNILKVCIICVGFGSDEAWLWKRYAGRNSVVSTGLPAGGHECGSSTCRYDHITALLHRLHCFHVSQRISFKLPSWFTSASVDLVPPIWTTPFSRSPGFLADNAIVDVGIGCPSTRLSTVGDRAFPVAAARTWNSLPAEVT